MTTWAASGVTTCSNCGCAFADHDRDGRCPRDISQPVSRVVAGPSTPHCQGGTGHCGSEWCVVCARVVIAETTQAPVDLLAGARAVVHSIGGDPLVIQVQNHAEASLDGLYERLGPDSDIAAFRALSAEQLAALLQIGVDGPALLKAAREAAKREASLGVYGPRGPLATVMGRIDARKV